MAKPSSLLCRGEPISSTRAVSDPNVDGKGTAFVAFDAGLESLEQPSTFSVALNDRRLTSDVQMSYKAETEQMRNLALSNSTSV